MLSVDFSQATQWVGAFFWPMMRISAMLIAMPVLGTRLVPTRIKIITALVLTLFVMPMLPELPRVEPLSLDGLLISIQQILAGLATGFIIQFVFAALIIAGQAIAMSMGLGFASMIDPANGTMMPVVSQFFIIVGTLLFFALGGHLMIFQIIISSFQSLPISTVGIDRESFWMLVSWSSQMFIGAMWIAVPALISMLAINITMGVMTRAAPQMNIFSVGFPITMFMGFIILFLMMPGFLPRFNQLLLDAMQVSQAMVKL